MTDLIPSATVESHHADRTVRRECERMACGLVPIAVPLERVLQRLAEAYGREKRDDE